MDCIVVGGVANGVLLKRIRMDAQWIELKRPEYIKPLESKDSDAEVVHEKDVYEIHALTLTNTNEPGQHVFGIAVVEGQSLTWAYSQLVIGFVKNTTAELIADGLIQTN